MTAPVVLDGAMNVIAFRAYVGLVLLPPLAPGDIVVMDNLPAHKAEGEPREVATRAALEGYSVDVVLIIIGCGPPPLFVMSLFLLAE